MTYVFPLWCSLLPFIHFSLKSICISLSPISQAFPGDHVLLWGLTQWKCESSKRSLQALSGMRDGLLSFTPPCCQSHLVVCKPALCKCLDQSGEKKACVRIGFSNRRDRCCSHTGQPPSPAGESLPESPHCCFVPFRAWLSYPQHLPCQGKVLGWAPCFPPLGPAAWWGGSCGSSGSARPQQTQLDLRWKPECCREGNRQLSSTGKNLPVESHPPSANISGNLAFDLDEPTIFWAHSVKFRLVRSSPIHLNSLSLLTGCAGASFPIYRLVIYGSSRRLSNFFFFPTSQSLRALAACYSRLTVGHCITRYCPCSRTGLTAL